MKNCILALFCLVWLNILCGCSGTRYLNKNQYLLRKSVVKLKVSHQGMNKGDLADQLSLLRLQTPNTYLFGLFPYKLWLYDLRHKKYQKDSTNFQISSKIVERPTVYDSSLTRRSAANMLAYLRNQGYFYASVEDTVAFRKKKAFVSYKVNASYAYLVDSMLIRTRDSAIKKLIPILKTGTLLSHGTIYRNATAGEERDRLVNKIRNYGYYKFNVDNISFVLDTLDKPVKHAAVAKASPIHLLTENGNKANGHWLDVRTIIHHSEDSLAFQQFTFNKVVVFSDFSDSLKVDSANYASQMLNGINYRFHKGLVHAAVLDKKIFIRPGNLYSQNDYNKTLRQLSDLGIFQYVRIYIIEPKNDSTHHLLNCYIVMSPNEKYNFQTNIEVSGGDLYTIGTAANVSVTDNNFLRGANQLTATLSYGLELGQNKVADLPFLKQFYFFSRNLGVNFKLSFPKFLLPVNQAKFSRNSLPTTFVEAGVNSLNRIDYFSLRSINSSFGYLWNESLTKSWTVKPVFVNILHLSKIDPSFQERMDSVPAIRHSYQETFIEGEAAEFVVNNFGVKPQKHAYLKLGVEEAGALVSGISGIFGSPLNLNNAHYVRFDFDAKQYWTQRNNSFILRFDGGIGVPYAGSTVLPYIKQYFVGGAYSIRGWRPRVLGPGSYNAMTGNPDDNLFIDESGDIKLEWSAEYRFSMIKLFSGAINVNGAFFTDAGNIWLAHKDEKLPGAEFNWETLGQDIAVSPGAGLRLDLGGFLVVRLDWAFPVKKPYVLENNGWVWDKIDFASKEWRQENINLNIAIGYPF